MDEFTAPEMRSHIKELQGLLLSEETLASTLDRVVRLACDVLEGCDAVGVTLVVDDRPSTAAATDDFTLEIDRQQYVTGEGPCLDAYRSGEMIEIEEVQDEVRWPEFIRRAAKAGLRSSLALPLSVRDRQLGALNVYSKSPSAFGEQSRSLAREFGAQAGVALANAQVYESTLRLVENLSEALKSREVIGQAKGILMAQQGLNDAEAFELLIRLSQSSNVKLREIARRVVDRAAEES